MCIVGLSEPGWYHIQECIPNQDCILTGLKDRYRVIVLADGVSTCSKSGEGARIACIKTRDFVLVNAERLFRYKEETISEYIVDNVYRALSRESAVNNCDVNDYSSTLSAVLFDSKTNKAISFHLGDGIILLANDKGCSVLGAPSDHHNGTPVTTTEKAFKLSTVIKCDIANDNSVLICSDGAWTHMYNKGLLKKEVLECIVKCKFYLLDDYIRASRPDDDYSYVAMKI